MNDLRYALRLSRLVQQAVTLGARQRPFDAVARNRLEVEHGMGASSKDVQQLLQRVPILFDHTLL